MEYLNEFYNSHEEQNRLGSKHGSVEFLTTMRYIDRYLKPGMRIIEIGAGPGRYSHALARRGFSVDAVELIECNIELFKADTEPGEDVRITQGNACDLSGFSDNTYDITLLLGPMYHICTGTLTTPEAERAALQAQKKAALSEALRVTKPGGIVFVAYCIADASILNHGFKDGHIFELIEKHMVDTETFKAYSGAADLFELHRKEDIDALMSGFNVEHLHYVATDLYTNHMSDDIDAMDDRMFELYLKYHYTICERSDMVGLTNHSLDVFRKL